MEKSWWWEVRAVEPGDSDPTLEAAFPEDDDPAGAEAVAREMGRKMETQGCTRITVERVQRV